MNRFADLCAVFASLANLLVMLRWPLPTQPPVPLRAKPWALFFCVAYPLLAVVALVSSEKGWTPAWTVPLLVVVTFVALTVDHCRRLLGAAAEPNPALERTPTADDAVPDSNTHPPQ